MRSIDSRSGRWRALTSSRVGPASGRRERSCGWIAGVSVGSGMDVVLLLATYRTPTGRVVREIDLARADDAVAHARAPRAVDASAVRGGAADVVADLFSDDAAFGCCSLDVARAPGGGGCAGVGVRTFCVGRFGGRARVGGEGHFVLVGGELDGGRAATPGAHAQRQKDPTRATHEIETAHRDLWVQHRF